MPSPERAAVEEAMGKAAVKAVWTANYEPVLPFTLQDFDIGALLPAMLYMARRGHRRGKGRFEETFARGGSGKPSVSDVATTLSQDATRFKGFDEGVGHAVLCDLLLCYCLENKRHATGREQQVQRSHPTHFFVSHLDLPLALNALRFVPEMLTAALAGQRDGDFLQPGKGTGRTFFPVGVRPSENLLSRLMAEGVVTKDQAADLQADQFDERAEVGLDQLLTIRLAQACKYAPEKVRSGEPRIPNRQPLCSGAASTLNEDLRVFIVSYGNSVPRHALLPMLEVAIGINLANMLLTTLRALVDWRETGSLPQRSEQRPWPLLVDCSNGVDNRLRRAAEESFDRCHRSLAAMPVTLMGLRLAEYLARKDLRLKGKIPASSPTAAELVALLGELIFDRHDRSEKLEEEAADWCEKLADELEKAELEDELVGFLRRDERGHLWRLSEALVTLMGEKQQFGQIRKCLDSCMLFGHPHGLIAVRRVATNSPTGKKTRDARSAVLSNTALDFLVHRHLRKPGNGARTKPVTLSLPDFIELLRDRYGYYVDEAPPGASVSRDLLHDNRRVLERRLRDLGLLVGVNDAESMKRLQQRFEASAPVLNGGDFNE